MEKNLSVKPQVTVLMPAYNAAETIAKAVESVSGQLYDDFEFLIINDGSEDDTAKVVENVADERIRYLENDSNLGIQKTLNRGIRESKGKYIARIDADDSWVEREKLKEQVAFLENNPDHVLVGTGAIVTNEDGDELFRYKNPATDYEIRQQILGKNCFLHPSVVYRKSAVDQVGLYDESEACLHIEDYDLWLRMGMIGKLANLKMYGIVYRKSDMQISSQNKMTQLRGYLRLIRKYKDNYPGYWKALFRSYVRIYLYGWLRFDELKKWLANWKLL